MGANAETVVIVTEDQPQAHQSSQLRKTCSLVWPLAAANDLIAILDSREEGAIMWLKERVRTTTE